MKTIIEENDMEIIDYYGIKRQELDELFLSGSNEKILTHANGLIDEVLKQYKNNNERLARLNLAIIKLMIEYVNDGLKK